MVVSHLGRRVALTARSPMNTPTDGWSPTQYERFQAERAQPFHDLVSLVRPSPSMRILDLGCGTGELTSTLASLAPDATVLGIDSSAAMLEKASRFASASVRFEQCDIARFDDFGSFDLVFSNAALQWVADNETLVARILHALPAGGQIAVQVPANERHTSHTLASELAREPEYAAQLGGFVRESNILTLERYATLLYEYGFGRTECLERVYPHVLASTDEVVEWVKGTLLTAYLSRLDSATSAEFVADYRERLTKAVGAHTPYFYPFRRLFFAGTKAE
jgi:trans-aconitate 2-methyltransferase